jgi:hypothetical protein
MPRSRLREVVGESESGHGQSLALRAVCLGGGGMPASEPGQPVGVLVCSLQVVSELVDWKLHIALEGHVVGSCCRGGGGKVQRGVRLFVGRRGKSARVTALTLMAMPYRIEKKMRGQLLNMEGPHTWGSSLLPWTFPAGGERSRLVMVVEVAHCPHNQDCAFSRLHWCH